MLPEYMVSNKQRKMLLPKKGDSEDADRVRQNKSSSCKAREPYKKSTLV